MTICTSIPEVRPPFPTCPESLDSLHCPCRVDGRCCWCGDGVRQETLPLGGRK